MIEPELLTTRWRRHRNDKGLTITVENCTVQSSEWLTGEFGGERFFVIRVELSEAVGEHPCVTTSFILIAIGDEIATK